MNINPQFPYYILLYVLTVILRLIRAYRARPVGASREELIQYRWRYLLFGFELVNVSAGVFILLSEKAPTYVGTIMMLYVILVIVSFFFDEDGVGIRLRVAGHLAVSTIVLAVTIGAFTYMFAPEKVAEATPVDVVPEITPESLVGRWRVALPYIDQTLNRNFGVRENPLKSVYIISVEAVDRSAAIRAAREKFLSEDGPAPFLEKIKKTPYVMMPLEAEGVAERVLPAG